MFQEADAISEELKALDAREVEVMEMMVTPVKGLMPPMLSSSKRRR